LPRLWWVGYDLAMSDADEGYKVVLNTLGRMLTELRRSNAAGKHGRKRRDRYNELKKALGQEKRDNHGE
jgi:hypothetical protein